MKTNLRFVNNPVQNLSPLALWIRWIVLFFFLYTQSVAAEVPSFHFTKVQVGQLPSPYHYLLQQPLMTIGIENYYRREAKIHKISAQWNKKTNTYTRTIIMLIDNDRVRNNVKLAEAQKTALVVELAFIEINFNALSNPIKKAVLHTDLPFGKLLATNKIATRQEGLSFFSLKCDAFIAKYLSCTRRTKIFGRRNTLVRKSDGIWLAKVVEILSGRISL